GQPDAAWVNGLRPADRFNILGDRLNMHEDFVQLHRGDGDLAADLWIVRIWRASGGQRGARGYGFDGEVQCSLGDARIHRGHQDLEVGEYAENDRVGLRSGLQPA